MHAAATAVSTPASRTSRFYGPARSPHSLPISSHRARFTRITASTLATGVSFITPASRTDGGAERWRMFLSSASLMATASESDATGTVSILARWWSGRARGWVNAAIAF